ncbi:serine/arginine repetitive matrix protein 1-like isoform X2 [Ostrea edulis]|uniref:serine/arginine repetitive matrix protein 1-like isoform X2 n=1 Tax=Ostrea edulis TaxID=37623 RepID=UPI0024AEA31B|nr:serine/arginine repetitive matrix protein 1-like isoform X2 [Ostrea edulis]
MAQIPPPDSRNISDDPLSLEEILTVFNNPINEEQAWAVCHQCANYFLLETARRTFRDLYTHGIRSVRIKKDGDVVIEASELVQAKGHQVRRRNSVTGKDIKVVTESDAIQALGVVIYHALDYGLQESEERHLSRNLEHLLEVMINPDEEDDEELQNACDEGIEKDAKEGYSFSDIIVLCAQHLSNEQSVGQHYKAVCKALVAEAEELLTFLNRISSGKRQLKKVVQDEDQTKLDELQRSDWARLWVQIMKELRRGVRLKAVEHTTVTPTEYELTPFEIILEDIRSRRYTLNKVMVNGDIPTKVKKDAHAVILDFIRSRPPLHPVKKRVLNSPPKIELQPREQILQEIRSQPKLRPVRERKIVETSRTKLNNEDEEESPQPIRKVIKPDFTLFLDSFDESENDNSSSMGSSHSSITSPSPEKDNIRWRRAVVRDVATSERHGTNLERRHTIMVCESPQVFPPAPSGTVPLQLDATDNKSHESRGKLRRSAPVSKSRACVNDARQKRLSLPLHGIHEEECVDGKSLHDPACGFNSVSEESEIFEEYVFDRSKGLRMPITRSHYQSLSRSATITEVVSSSKTVSNSKSSSDVKEKPRPMARSRSSSDMKPSVLVRARTIPRSQSSDEGHVTDSKEQRPDTTEIGGASSRPRPKPAPRTSISRNSPVLTRQQVESETKEVRSNSSVSHVISDSDRSKHVSKRHSSASEIKVRRTSSESLSLVEGENSGHRVRRSSQHSDKSPRQQVSDGPGEEETVSKQQRESSPSSRRHRDSSSPSRRHRDSSSPSRRHRDSSSPSRRHRDSSSPSRQHRESHHSEGSSRRHRREGRDESGHSEVVKHDERSHHIHRHRLSSHEEEKSEKESEKFLRQSKDRVPLKRSTRMSEEESDRFVTLNRKSSFDDKHCSDSESPKLELKSSSSPKLELKSSSSPKPEVKSSSSPKLQLKSSSSPKPEVKSRQSLQLSKSGGDDSPVQKFVASPKSGDGDISVQKSMASPVLSSAEPVQRRYRPQAVSRSQSHKNFYRHSTDFSGSCAIVPEVSTSSSPAGHGIMLGRYRKEAEELLKPVHQEEDMNSRIPERTEDSESPERLPSKLSELNVSELLHVSGSPEFGAVSTNGVPSSSSPDSDSAKWTHPIECLSLTLEEVTHIRQVLTKAELETLITNHEIYNLVSKGKVCFTCKLVKFSMFGQWGTRCKICKRNVCNNCLRKMNIPTEHFQKIPVHTLSPIPLSQETLDIIKVYESTGSVPHTPSSERKTQQTLEDVSPRRKSLQRSNTIGAGSAPTLPNKNLLKGPQMSVCCDCKSMIMEIIRTSRTSIALINKGQGAMPSPSKEEEKGEGLNLSTLSLNIKQFFNK